MTFKEKSEFIQLINNNTQQFLDTVKMQHYKVLYFHSNTEN